MAYEADVLVNDLIAEELDPHLFIPLEQRCRSHMSKLNFAVVDGAIVDVVHSLIYDAVDAIVLHLQQGG